MTRRFSQWLLFGSWLCVPLAAATLAGAPADWTGDLSPIAPADWTYERAAHLIERAGFGATPEEIERAVQLTPQQAVDQLDRELKLEPRDEMGKALRDGYRKKVS